MDYPTSDSRRMRSIIEEEAEHALTATANRGVTFLRQEIERAMWRLVGRELGDRTREGWRQPAPGYQSQLDQELHEQATAALNELKAAAKQWEDVWAVNAFNAAVASPETGSSQ